MGVCCGKTKTKNTPPPGGNYAGRPYGGQSDNSNYSFPPKPQQQNPLGCNHHSQELLCIEKVV